jgi:tol-pal system protein YbgF
VRYNSNMGSPTSYKLGCCVAALLVGCAGHSIRSSKAEETKTHELQRKVAENEAEVRRLQRLLDLETQQEVSEPNGLEDAAQMPVTQLKPEPIRPPVTDPDEDVFDARSLVVSSQYESMTWYNQGLTLMQGGKFDEAVGAFARFLRMGPEHVYADRAQFWMAECHFRNREFGLAVVAYNLVVSQYPDSIKVPEAMYQAALAHLKMGQSSAAKNLLHDLLRQFPMDSMATPASKKLAEITGLIPHRF